MRTDPFGMNSLKVLLIEDNPHDRRLAEAALREGADGFAVRCEVQSAACLTDGLATLDSAGGTLDAILLDLTLPDANGLGGLRAVRNLNARVPIVIVTGRSDLDTATAALKYGASDFLEKSEVQPRSLLRAIRYAIERKKSEAELTRLAQTDPLTGLFNRRAFFERLDHALVQHRRSELACAVVVFDIDRFKDINDLFGHKTGDDLLTAVATKLRANLRESDSIGRIGGDEFAILAPNLKSASDAMEIADKVLTSVRSIQDLDDVRVDPQISIGISVFPMDDSDAEAFVSHADMAMYKSKASKKGSVNFYDQRMDASVKERHTMKRKIRGDIDSGRFFLLFQPIIDAKSGAMIGAEGLARWRDIDGRVIAPDQFIPLAEESGSISSLGSRLLQEACCYIRACAENRTPIIPISLNVSTLQCCDPTFALTLISAIESFQIPPTMINVEITESTIIKNIDVTRNNLKLLKQYGVGVHLDDFGTGYSSLSLLRELPIDALKIDRSFVGDLGKISGSDPIVNAVVELSKRLGFATIAEGVETKAQADMLREIGVTALQGFHFSEPISGEDLTARMLDHAAAAMVA